LLAELFVPIPNSSQTALNAKLIDHQFSSEETVLPKYNALGSGKQFSFHF